MNFLTDVAAAVKIQAGCSFLDLTAWTVTRAIGQQSHFVSDDSVGLQGVGQAWLTSSHHVHLLFSLC